MHTVLVVDDEPAVVEALTAQLLPMGVWIEGAYSAEEALSLVEAAPAVVIADYLMPGMKGDDFLIEVHRRLPEARLILLTGQAGAENVGKIINHARLFRYIAKPWEVEDLRLTVRQALESYETEKALQERTRLTQELVLYLREILECESVGALTAVVERWEMKLFPSHKADTVPYREARELFDYARALRQAHLTLLQELEAQVQARTAHLVSTIQELKALTSQREAWVKIVSHDLRGPIGGLKQLAALLKQNASSSPALSRYTDILEKSLSELERYVKNLLDLSRLSQKEIALQTEPFEWKEMANRLYALIAPQLEAKGIHWRAEVEPLTGWGDPVYTAEALYNILSNAVKFTPSGGTVTLRVYKEGEDTVVEIKDTGIGMTSEQLNTLWDPTQRRSRPGTAGEKGTGLGLPLAHAILTQQGVSITVESAPQQGTTFRLRWRSFA
ncbi:MAG: hybrid sensor histidine kinase/response regulator [Bacteroidia bacterium]|nr:hybrid sensor histidine kinase/response regulator [Bacteroidia bacterium]MDW8057826.1 hybrid sensor histidine kinase/response regulator [Bacteroidia bacterium]